MFTHKLSLMIVFCSICVFSFDAHTAPLTGVVCATLENVYQTAPSARDNLDSIAVWTNPMDESQQWMFVTAKETDQVHIYDASSGVLIDKLGKKGKDLGEFKRPNGIAVWENRLFVVERDNHRVQVFSLPDLVSLGFFGKQDLEQPYGIAIAREATGTCIYVTDQFDLPEEGHKNNGRKDWYRVKKYLWSNADQPKETKLLFAFGHCQQGPGALGEVESICVDPLRNRVFICDEIKHDLKVYNCLGQYTGPTLAQELLAGEPEGILIAEDSQSSEKRYLILTDQTEELTKLYVYDADSLDLLGCLTGLPVLARTDGIAFHSPKVGVSPQGRIYCLHLDQQVYGYDWQKFCEVLRHK